MAGPTFPVEIPGNDEWSPVIEGDQQMPVEGSLYLSHNGGNRPHSERPGSVGGTPVANWWVFSE